MLLFQDVRRLLRIKGPFAGMAAKKRIQNGRKLRASVGSVQFKYYFDQSCFPANVAQQPRAEMCQWYPIASNITGQKTYFHHLKQKKSQLKRFCVQRENCLDFDEKCKAKKVFTKSLRLSDFRSMISESCRKFRLVHYRATLGQRWPYRSESWPVWLRKWPSKSFARERERLRLRHSRSLHGIPPPALPSTRSRPLSLNMQHSSSQRQNLPSTFPSVLNTRSCSEGRGVSSLSTELILHPRMRKIQLCKFVPVI